MNTNNQQVNRFTHSLEVNARHYQVDLTRESIAQLANYYELLLIWNPRLHLVAPCPPEEFATRHVLESLLLVPYLGQKTTIVDIGSGAGLPIIPCLIARPDINCVLIESSQKKAVFLREALNLNENARAKVIAARFEDVAPPEATFVTSRALDRFVEILPRLVEWAPSPSTLLLFGGVELQKALEGQRLSFETLAIPNSERRFLFVARRT